MPQRASCIILAMPSAEKNFLTAIGFVCMSVVRVTSKLSPRPVCIRHSACTRHHLVYRAVCMCVCCGNHQSHNFSTLTKGALCRCRRSCAAAAATYFSNFIILTFYDRREYFKQLWFSELSRVAASNVYYGFHALFYMHRNDRVRQLLFFMDVLRWCQLNRTIIWMDFPAQIVRLKYL